MSGARRTTIPYEEQGEKETNRMCGAAALRMVYRSFAGTYLGSRAGTRATRVASRSKLVRGPDAPERRSGKERREQDLGPPQGAERRIGQRRAITATQAEIFARIAKPNRFGQSSCSVHLMVKDALSRGLTAVAIQAPHPLQALVTCRRNGIRAILNHRLRPESPAGHFSVLVGMDADNVIVHDPFVGPSRRIPYAQLLELWQPGYPGSEIAGNLLIGITNRNVPSERCRGCDVPMPRSVGCPRCANPVPLAPAELLGCVGDCLARGWTYVVCPACDFTWSFTAGPVREPEKETEGIWNLGPLFAELAKFKTHVLSIPEAASRDDVKQQLASIDESKEKLRLAEREEIARRAGETAREKESAETLRKEEEAIEKAKEAATAPAPPVDGSALGDALLADLGIQLKR